ncbi:MAG: hypothetical protein ACJ763_16150 [Bdellovibrionia bacterium]
MMSLVSGSLLSSSSAWSAKSSTSSSDYKKAQEEFTSACRESFRKSTTPTSDEVGKTICECTAKDSKNQGAKASDLRKEAAEIRKNSKHEIQNQNVMNAFRWCTIELMQKAEAEEHGNAS